MKKKVTLSLAALFAVSLSNVVGAAPLTDYSAGKVAIDASVQVAPNLEVKQNGTTETADAHTSYKIGATAGIGNNWALQYNYNRQASEKDGSALRSQEYNALYKINNNFSGVVGFTESKISDGKSQNDLDLGFVAYAPINDKMTAFGGAMLGNDIARYNLGVAYAVDKNLDFNLEYYNNGIKDMKVDNSNVDKVTSDGIDLGLTLRF